MIAILATLLLPLIAVWVLGYILIAVETDAPDPPTYVEPSTSQRREWAADLAAVRATLACDGYKARRVHAGLFARAA